MHDIFLISGDFFGILFLGTSLFYAPFARGWVRAVVVPFALSIIWVVLRVFTIVCFREPSSGMRLIVCVPFAAVIYAVAARGVKIFMFRIPSLKQLKQKVRTQFGKSDSA